MRFPSLKICSVITFTFFVILSCKKEDSEPINQSLNNDLTPYKQTFPNYFPILNIPADNQQTLEAINLGRKLYYDPILSNNGMSCSSCHNSKNSFSTFSSNSLPHVNLAWNKFFLWNGKIEGGLENIMMFEVESFFNSDISKLNNSGYYRQLFKSIYKTDSITSKHVAYALAQFFRVMTSSNSLCDKFLQRKSNLSQSEMNGFNIFTTEKGDCFHCHSIGLFTDNMFHNIGNDSVFDNSNSGRFMITKNNNDIGLYKTPTLRNIELTAPYMHDGRFNTLEEVVEHYNSGVKRSNTLDPIMTKPGKEYGLRLTPNEIKDVVAFLKTLTDTTFINNPLLQIP